MSEDNLYQRGETWYLRVMVNGKRVARSLRTSNRAEAKRRRDREIKRLKDRAFCDEPQHSYLEALKRWTEEYPSQVKPSVMKRYLVSARQLHRDFEQLKLAEITRARIADYVSARRKDGASNATIKRDLTALSTILSSAVSWGWLEVNPALLFDRRLIRERRDPIIPPSDADVLKAIANCPPTFGLAVRFLRQTGLRAEECFSLERKQVTKTEIRLYQTKTGRPRTIDLTDPLLRPAVATILATPTHMHSPFLFWHGDGARWWNMSSRFQDFKRKAGVDFRLHDLRHKFAIRYLERGGDIYRLSRILGHSSVKTTEMYLGYVATKVATDLTVFEVVEDPESTVSA